MEKESKNYLWWHVIGVISFLMLPIVLYPHPPEIKNFLFTAPTIRDFIANSLMVIFFYLNYYYLIPLLFQKKKYVRYGLIILLSFGLIIYLPSMLTGFVPFIEHFRPKPRVPMEGMPRPNGEGKYWDFMSIINNHVLLYLSVVLLSILLRMREQLFQAEKSKSTAELNSLKSQVNPHFLFNTLNSIYGMAVKDKSMRTAESIIKLSSLMRYVVTEAEAELVPLKKELDYIENYIALQKLRLDKEVKLKYTVYSDSSGKFIVPLILIPLIENAFKHGVNPDEPSEIKIHIECENSLLILNVENKIVQTQLAHYEKSGHGIENVKSRLAYLYPKKHQIRISSKETLYRVHLSLDLS